MRHPVLITLVTIGLLAAPAAMASAHTASAGRTPAIACPERTALVTPCCGPLPVVPSPAASDAAALCCPATATCAVPSALSISSSPDPSTAGQSVTVGGSFASGAGDTMTLWQELPGQSSFQQLAFATAGPTGAYSFALGPGSVTTDRSWYVTGGLDISATVTQQVSAGVSLSASRRTIRAGSAVLLSGLVTPSHRGERVALLQQVGADWNVIAHVRLGASSGFRLRHRLRSTGRVRLRAELPADSRNVQSFSRVVSVTVAARR